MGSLRMRGMLDWEEYSDERPSDTVKVAFKAGSSRHGKASRAEVGSNCVTANHLISGTGFALFSLLFEMLCVQRIYFLD